jgi:HlyD family secretion protein
VDRGTVETVVTATGTLQATETVDVGTQVSGQVAQLLVDFNDHVTKGQLLARIDPTILQQEVRAAEASVMRSRAELDQSERTLQRNRDLHEARVLTDVEFEQSQYSYTVAKAAYSSSEVGLERARRNLSYTEVRAPIDGVVVERSVDVGQTVAASMSAPTLFLLAEDLTEMEILASVDESDIGKITQGQEVRFTVQAYGDRSFTGAVKQVRLQSKNQDNVVSYSVVIGLENEDMKLLPGMTATVQFVVARAEDVLRVPNAALRFQPTDEMTQAVAARREAQGGEGAPGSIRPVASTTSARQEGAQQGSANNGASGRSGRGQRAAGQGASNRAMLWVTKDGQPDVVPVRTGLTDGQYTEISGQSLEEGMQVIVGVTTGQSAATQAAPNPFQNGSQQGRSGAGGPPRF